MASFELASPNDVSIVDIQLRCQTDINEFSETDFSATDMECTPIDEKPTIDYKTNGNHSAEQPVAKPIETTDLCQRGEMYFTNGNVVELARCSWRGSKHNQKFLKGCLWSPDGTCALTAINGEGMQVFELPRDLYANDSVNVDRPLDILQNVIHVGEGGTVYDFCWYPFMNSSDPTSCW